MENKEHTEEQVVEEAIGIEVEETAEEIKPISREEELESEVSALKDKMLRTAAEFENFKKRTAKEKEELFSMGICTAIEKLLLIKDTLERAIPTMEGADAKAIPAVGEKFDPEKHNAVMHDENEKFDENTISEEFMKGYMYKEKVIRHSMVKVSN